MRAPRLLQLPGVQAELRRSTLALLKGGPAEEE